jgi:pyruvate/2-oxoglutarate dehydrogenase complex dihydrolipoamide acyltransferase (E2) component
MVTMDNIQKMILGMVAIVAVIVIIMPQGNPLAEKGPAEPAKAEVAPAAEALKKEDEGTESPPPPAKNPNEAPAPSANTEVTNFGMPMMDPTPAAERAERERREKMQEQQMSSQGGQQEGPNGDQGNYDDDANTSGPAY